MSPRLALPAALLLALVLSPLPGWARPYTVEDLLNMEQFGQISVDPSDRRLVFERIGPSVSGTVFDHGYYSRNLRAELFTVDLDRPGPARRLLPASEGAGHILGPWSPSGDRLVIYRMRDRRWTAGVLDLKQGQVRWLPLSPETSGWGRSVQWRSNETLVMIAQAEDEPPWVLSPWRATRRLTDAWAAAREGRQPTRVEVGAGAFLERSPRWPPNHLVTVDAATGRIRRLAEGRFHDLELSTSGRFAAVLGFGEPTPVDIAVPFIQGQWPYRRTVTIADLERSRIWSPLPGGDVLPNLLAWSPVADTLLVWSRSGKEDWPDGDLARITPTARTAERVDLGGFRPAMLETGLRTPVVVADWLGPDPLLYAVGRSDRRDWVRLASEPEPLTQVLPTVPARIVRRGRNRAWLLAEQGLWEISKEGAVRRTPVDLPVEAAPVSRVDMGERFAFNSPPDRGGGPAAIAREGHAFNGLPGLLATSSQAPEAGGLRVLTERTSVTMTVDDSFRERLTVSRSGTGPIEVARVNDHALGVAFARRRPVHHRGPSGEALTSWLYLPPRDAPRLGSGPPPLIVSPYPGSTYPTAPAFAEPTARNPMISVPVLTGAGFAVLLPSLPREAHAGEPTRDLAAQALAVVDAAAKDGVFDPERLALWGHSFGGFAVIAVATQTDRFDAVVAASGIYDLVGAWGGFPPDAAIVPQQLSAVRSRAGWAETGQPRMGGPPWAEPERYLRNSPLLSADRISAPVLLIAPERDFMPTGQAEAVFSALYRQNKDAVLLTYLGEAHTLVSPANIRDMTDRTLGWLREVLARPTPVSAPTAVAPRSSSAPSSPG